MDYREFASKIRNKYPGAYDDMDDRMLAEKIVQKYPQYSDVTFDEPKGFLRRTAERVVDSPALPIAGGVIGGLAALPSGPGAVGGAALGGAAGEAYRQIGARALGMDAPDTSMEAAKKIGIEGATQGVAEATGSYVLGPIARGAGRLLKKPAGDLFQIITKMRPEDAATLFKNPSTLFPGRFKRAQAAWRKAAEDIGIPVDDVSPEMLEILKGDGRKIVFETFEKLQKGEAVTAKEAQIAKQALDSVVMPVAKTIRKNPQIATLQKIKRAFIDRLSQESPEMAAANREYAIGATGKKFRSLFPRNTTGDPAYFRSSVFPSLLTGAGALRGDPMEGALQGAAVGAISSPLAIGTGIAALGGIRPAMPLFRRAAVSTASKLFKNKLDRKENVSGKGGPESTAGELSPQEPRDGQQIGNGNRSNEQGGYSNNGVTDQTNQAGNSLNQGTPLRAGRKIDRKTAQDYMKRVNYDRAKARRMALADGWAF